MIISFIVIKECKIFEDLPVAQERHPCRWLRQPKHVGATQ